MDQSASNVLIDLLLWLSHSDGTDPGGAKSEMMKAVMLMLLLLVDKKALMQALGYFSWLHHCLHIVLASRVQLDQHVNEKTFLET